MRIRLVGLFVSLTVLMTSCHAYPPPFGPNEVGNHNTVSGLLFSDNSTLSWRSVECDNSAYLWFNFFMFYTMLTDVDATDLTSAEKTQNPCGSSTAHPNDDIFWFATPQSNFSTTSTLGDYTCMSQAGTSSLNCQRGRFRWLETMQGSSDNATHWNVACHEIAHTLGFQHGTTGLSCMDEGNTGDFDNYMNGRINAHY